MSQFFAVTMILAFLGGSRADGMDDPDPKRATRTVEGRVLDDQGRPARMARVMFGPLASPAPFTEGSTAMVDLSGRFRIELADFALESGPIPATRPLRYLTLAPGFRQVLGRIDAGPGPSSLEIQLIAEPWKTTEIRIVDRDGHPIHQAEVTLAVGGSVVWERLQSDSEGRCRVSMATGQSFSVTIRQDGYLPTTFGLRGVADDPASFKIPLRASIRGRVVDPEGKSLAGIRIGRSMSTDWNDPQPQGQLHLYPLVGTKEPATTDAEGRFTLTPTIRLDTRTMDRSGEFRVGVQTLCFADEAFRRCTFLGVDLKNISPSYEVTLRPTRAVRIPIEHEVAIASGDLESGYMLTSFGDPTHPGPGLFVSEGIVKPSQPGGDRKLGEQVEEHWPAGKYRIKVNSADPRAGEPMEETEVDFVVPPGEGPLILPAIRLTATKQHRLIGQPAPEIDARDLDTNEPVRLADFRGKVVVLDFWGYWCGPCVGSMPGLVEVDRHFKGQPVVILALHDQSVQSRETYNRKLAGVKQSLWNDQDLPFRVALDRPVLDLPADQPTPGTGVTCKRYAIQGFPTTLIIDQDGKVVGLAGFRETERLKATIKELLEKDPPR